ncbi:MAG: RDD family protein [Candidatus Acidiferrales bacterium]
METYRSRRRRGASPENQGQLPFGQNRPCVAEGETSSIDLPAGTEDTPWNEEFAFTIAIGRRPNSGCGQASPCGGPERVDIDLTVSPTSEGWRAPDVSTEDESVTRERRANAPFLPVAPLSKRCAAGIVDALCLLFSYGGFLMLFSSLGGHFNFSKLNAIVCVATLALFYIQYFTLFTIFGGTTPGMMLCGLQLIGYEGESATPRQLLARSLGYVLSAGTFFLGFLWAHWDEDRLTWHDRVSRTYVVSDDAILEASPAAATHGR